MSYCIFCLGTKESIKPDLASANLDYKIRKKNFIANEPEIFEQ